VAKSKLSEFKQLIAEMNEEELRAELMKLYNKIPTVKELYNQDLMTEEERQELLKTYKARIYKEYWTPKGNPKSPNNTNIKNIIGEYEKTAVFPYDIIDLLLYRVETTTDFANEFGGASDGTYNGSITSFKKAVKLMNENNLRSHFEIQCKEIFKANNIDYWYIEQLEDIFDEGEIDDEG
jgi:Family of unknown function (DUF6155)